MPQPPVTTDKVIFTECVGQWCLDAGRIIFALGDTQIAMVDREEYTP